MLQGQQELAHIGAQPLSDEHQLQAADIPSQALLLAAAELQQQQQRTKHRILQSLRCLCRQRVLFRR